MQPTVADETMALLSLRLCICLWLFFLRSVSSEPAAGGVVCRTFCGNITVDYPLGTQDGCGHPRFKEVMYCINNVMMMRLASGGYQVLDIDYAFNVITLFDPQMATCRTVGKGSDGFMFETQQMQHLQPTHDTAFMLLGCKSTSPLFQHNGRTHLPCKNISGMSCDDYYECPSWVGNGARSRAQVPPPCCALRFSDVGNLNLSRLECFSYVAAYAAAPIRARSAREWSYGVQLNFFLPNGEDASFCRACKASNGVCGYDVVNSTNLCLCRGFNSTSTCDSGNEEIGGASLLAAPDLRLLALLFSGFWLVHGAFFAAF